MNLFLYILLIIVVLGWLGLIYFLFKGLRRLPSTAKEQLGRPAFPGEEGVVLAIEVPKENEKTPAAAELLFSSLHGISDRVSFEIEAREKAIRFYVWAPKALKGYVEAQIYAQYPEASIFETKDYFPRTTGDLVIAATELKFAKADFVPIKTFLNFEADPIAGLTAALGNLAGSERMWIQLVIRPTNENWRRQAVRYIEAVKTGRLSGSLAGEVMKGVAGLVGEAVRQAVTGPPTTQTQKAPVALSPGTELLLKAIEEKSGKLGFETKIRLASLASTPAAAKARLDLLLGAFRQFNVQSLNSFVSGAYWTDALAVLSLLRRRNFASPGIILNTTELASLYHLPNASVATPNIVWAGAKKGEPPANLPLLSATPPEELTILAKTSFRGAEELFGIRNPDRRRHIYVIGKSGVGKSTLLMNMSIADIRANRGVGIIDPHGEYAEKILDFVPNSRVNDVVLFSPADKEYPVAFNILELKDPELKTVVASGVVSVFKKIFGYSWGPRLEYWLRNSILALLDFPNATLLMVPRLLTEKEFRRKVVEKIKDPVLKSYWLNEFEMMDQRQRNETIGPILNKVGQFISSPLIRNIVGQPHSTIDFRKVMDEKKILVVNLSKGTIGEDNASLLGSLVITALQLAALSRANVPEAKREDFFLYVDEFQNFATDSFAVILSEARKYHLSLTIANQYMAQLPEEVRDAVFGNVGTIIAFRVGADDAVYLKREFAPVFDEEDLVNLDVFSIYVKLSVNGITTAAFSAKTLPLPQDTTGNREKIIALSREQYSKPRQFVEEKIQATMVERAEAAPAALGGEKMTRFQPGDFGPTAPRFRAVSKRAPRPKPKESLLRRLIEGIEKEKQATPPLEEQLEEIKKQLENQSPRSAPLDSAWDKQGRQNKPVSELKEGEEKEIGN